MNTEIILAKLGIEALNDMQHQAMRAIGDTRKDVVVLSPTGSGKTLAYLLPLVRLIDPSSDEVQAVVIVPGRELAVQSAQVMRSMGTGLRPMAIYGGARSTMDEHREIRNVAPQIIFATPGRLNDHLAKENFVTQSVKYLVIDEFDKCLEMGFRDVMTEVVSRLPKLERRFLLSATDADEIPSFVRISNVERIDCISGEESVSERVNIYKVVSPEKDKLETLDGLLRHFGEQSTIVFLNYRESVERTAAFLHERGFSVTAFHGGMEQREREDALYRFSNGSTLTLVCTDLGSRGLDIPDVQNIVHYHLPETAENYVHRTGRTARWDRDGRAFFLVNESELKGNNGVCASDGTKVRGLDVSLDKLPTYDFQSKAGRPPKAPMITIYIGKGKRDKISRGDIVGFLCKKGGLESNEIGRIDVRERYCYAAIKRNRLTQVLKNANGEKIKGKKTVVEC